MQSRIKSSEWIVELFLIPATLTDTVVSLSCLSYNRLLVVLFICLLFHLLIYLFLYVYLLYYF